MFLFLRLFNEDFNRRIKEKIRMEQLAQEEDYVISIPETKRRASALQKIKVQSEYLKAESSPLLQNAQSKRTITELTEEDQARLQIEHLLKDKESILKGISYSGATKQLSNFLKDMRFQLNAGEGAGFEEIEKRGSMIIRKAEIPPPQKKTEERGMQYDEQIFHSVHDEIEGMKKRIKELEAEIKNLRHSNAEFDVRCRQGDIIYKRLERDFNELRVYCEDTEISKEKAEERLRESLDECKKLSRNIEKMSNSIDKKKIKIMTLKARIKVLETASLEFCFSFRSSIEGNKHIKSPKNSIGNKNANESLGLIAKSKTIELENTQKSNNLDILVPIPKSFENEKSELEFYKTQYEVLADFLEQAGETKNKLEEEIADLKKSIEIKDYLIENAKGRNSNIQLQEDLESSNNEIARTPKKKKSIKTQRKSLHSLNSQNSPNSPYKKSVFKSTNQRIHKETQTTFEYNSQLSHLDQNQKTSNIQKNNEFIEKEVHANGIREIGKKPKTILPSEGNESPLNTPKTLLLNKQNVDTKFNKNVEISKKKKSILKTNDSEVHNKSQTQNSSITTAKEKEKNNFSSNINSNKSSKISNSHRNFPNKQTNEPLSSNQVSSSQILSKTKEKLLKSIVNANVLNQNSNFISNNDSEEENDEVENEEVTKVMKTDGTSFRNPSKKTIESPSQLFTRNFSQSSITTTNTNRDLLLQKVSNVLNRNTTSSKISERSDSNIGSIDEISVLPVETQIEVVMKKPALIYENFAEKVKTNPSKLLQLLKEYGFRRDDTISLGPFPSLQEFKEFFFSLRETHEKCGIACTHLLRFYEQLQNFQKSNKRETVKVHRRDLHKLPQIKRAL